MLYLEAADSREDRDWEDTDMLEVVLEWCRRLAARPFFFVCSSAWPRGITLEGRTTRWLWVELGIGRVHSFWLMAAVGVPRAGRASLSPAVGSVVQCSAVQCSASGGDTTGSNTVNHGGNEGVPWLEWGLVDGTIDDGTIDGTIDDGDGPDSRQPCTRHSLTHTHTHSMPGRGSESSFPVGPHPEEHSTGRTDIPTPSHTGSWDTQECPAIVSIAPDAHPNTP